MITYEKLFELLKLKGLTTYKIRKQNIISQYSYEALRHNKSVTTDTLNKLCNALGCHPEDILTFTADKEYVEEHQQKNE